MSGEQIVSVDEFLNERKGFVKSGDVVMKASKAPSSWNPETRTVHFTMSAEVEDRDRDIVFQAGLDTTEFEKNPVAPLMHRSASFPIGNWQNIQKNLAGRPKRTEGDLVLVKEGLDPDADRLANHIGAGTIRACSIGFIPKMVVKRETPEDKRETYFWPGYEIREATLLECSPVMIPANPAALAKMASEGSVYARELIEEILDNWAKHPETGLIIPKAEFETAHKQATGERTTVVAPEATGILGDIKSILARAFPAPQAESEIAAAEQQRQIEEQNAARAARRAKAEQVEAALQRSVRLNQLKQREATIVARVEAMPS
jgi:phage head maturation protease